MDHPKTVLISGAGIAGMTLAFWLAKYGFKVTVVERSPQPRDSGYAIDLIGPAVEVAKRMDIIDELRRLSTGQKNMVYVNRHGKHIADMSKVFEEFSGQGDAADIEPLRGDLTQVLRRITKTNIKYIWHDTITAIAQTKQKVAASFEHSGTRNFDLVIGADGVHSAVRALAFGNETEFVNHLGYYVSIFTIPNYLNLDNQELVYNTPGKAAGIFGSKQTGQARAIFYFASPRLAYNFHDRTEQQQLLANAYKGVGWEVPHLLELMPEAPDFYFDSTSVVDIPQWGRGRVALVGDAAYCASPLSGQGTSLAMVGAYVLAGELKVTGGDYETAFKNYQQIMSTYAKAGQTNAKANGQRFIPTSRLAITFRNLSLRILPYLPWKSRIIQQSRAGYEAITLKDY